MSGAQEALRLRKRQSLAESHQEDRDMAGPESRVSRGLLVRATRKEKKGA